MFSYESHTCTLCFPTDDHKFSEATAVLFTWIDRGEVNRRTANHFYSMIQSANSHVRRLMGEKAQHEEEMERAKETFKNALMAILTQCKNTFVFSNTYSRTDSGRPGLMWGILRYVSPHVSCSFISLRRELTAGGRTVGGAKTGQERCKNDHIIVHLLHVFNNVSTTFIYFTFSNTSKPKKKAF